MKNKDRIKFLLREGLSIQTIANLNETQLIVLSEKFKKKETKEEVKQTVTNVTYDPTNATDQKTLAQKGIHVDPSTKKISMTLGSTGEVAEDVTVDKNDAGAGQYSQAPHQVQAPDGMGDEGDSTIDKEEDLATESVLREKFESKAQQNFFWAKCNTTRGVQKQKWCKLAKEFSDETTKKDYKKMPEKLHPEKTVKYKKEKTNENLEKFLEKKIVSILENKVKPRMKKSDLVKLVKEKSESMILKNPKKVTMFSDEAPKPIRPKKK